MSSGWFQPQACRSGAPRGWRLGYWRRSGAPDWSASFGRALPTGLDREQHDRVRLAANRRRTERFDANRAADAVARFGVDQDRALDGLRVLLEARGEIHRVADARVGGALRGPGVA